MKTSTPKENPQWIPAVQNHNIELMREILIKEPQCINQQNVFGQTALMILMNPKQELNPECLSFILAHQPNMQIKDNSGYQAIHYALNLYNKILDDKDSLVISNQLVDEILMQNPASADIKGPKQLTPLIMAIKTHNNHAINSILKQNPDIHHTFEDGIGAMEWAVFEELNGVINTLYSHSLLIEKPYKIEKVIQRTEGFIKNPDVLDLLKQLQQHQEINSAIPENNHKKETYKI